MTLKSVPEALHRQHKARAVHHKRSLNQEVIAVLEEAEESGRPVDTTVFINEARRFRDSLTLTTTPTRNAAFIREGRA